MQKASWPESASKNSPFGIGGELRQNPDRLLLGVTGSIGTGKTTVSRMLEKKGAPVIDFDVLARVVVMPGEPAYHDIVSCFGEHILSEDKALDRKKLKHIVFNDMKKKRKLESFTHPRIMEKFSDLVGQLSNGRTHVIIQVVIPLLIEARMKNVFDHLLMVYAPEEVQLKRVLKRDKIDEKLAINMIRSQMSVEDKKRHCDFIVDNAGTLEETRKQVEALWVKLNEIQQSRG